MTTIEELKDLMLSVQSDVKSSINKMDNITKDVKSLKDSQDKLIKDIKICIFKYLVLEKKSTNVDQKISFIEKRLELQNIRFRYKNIFLYNVQCSSTDKANLLNS